MANDIFVTTFSCGYVQQSDSQQPKSINPSLSTQATAWLQKHDAVPISMTSQLVDVPSNVADIRSMSHILVVAWMHRVDWEKQQARITANALAIREADKEFQDDQGREAST